MTWKSYERARDLNGALALLAQAGGRGRVISGGTDLVLQLHDKEKQADLLVDVTRIEELQRLCEEHGHIRIGAAVTHGVAAESPLLKREAAVLAAGCGMVGSPQIRNIATLMGNVITAQPAADAAVPLTALEAELRVVSPAGERWVSMEAAYRGVGESAIDATREVAAEIRFRKPGAGAQTRFFRLARRRALALPVLNGAVCLWRDGKAARIREARIALGPVAAKPFRARQAEACLISDRITAALLEEAARLAAAEATPRTSLIRGSEEYRRAMIRLYLTRTLREMLDIG
jgi:carbon-monoxide dehydrogenase medium subunit